MPADSTTQVPNQASPFDVVITARPSLRRYLRDTWQYRELLSFLAARDLLVRYKQTAVGVAWSVVRPLITMLIFTLVFSRVAQLPSEGNAPYAVLVFAAMLPWNFFAGALSDSSASLVGSASIITKVYFPRVLIPAATVAVNAVDFLLALTVLFGLMLVLHVPFSARLLLLPLFLLPALCSALGLGLALASLNVKYRDVRFLVPLITQLGLYVSPVGFSSNVVPAEWRGIYELNPLVGVIDGFRWAILNTPGPPDYQALALAFALGLGLLAVGFAVLWRMERQFADVI